MVASQTECFKLKQKSNIKYLWVRNQKVKIYRKLYDMWRIRRSMLLSKVIFSNRLNMGFSLCPESKRQSMLWKHPDSQAQKKFRAQRSVIICSYIVMCFQVFALCHSFLCTQLNDFRYLYLTLIILFNTIHLHKVKRLQVLQCHTNPSIFAHNQMYSSKSNLTRVILFRLIICLQTLK